MDPRGHELLALHADDELAIPVVQYEFTTIRRRRSREDFPGLHARGVVSRTARPSNQLLLQSAEQLETLSPPLLWQ